MATGSITIAPNPTNDVFSLALTQVSYVQVLTIDGKLIDIYNGVNNLIFGGTYSKGTNIVRINNETKTEVLRVVKQ